MEKNNRSYRLIAVSGSSSTGKSLFSRNLSSILGWKIFSLSQKLRDEAKKNNIKITEINNLSDDKHRELDNKMIRTIKNETNLILESRLVGWQSKDHDDILKILITCNEKVKHQRYASRERLSVEQAKQEILNRDKSNLNKYINLYQVTDYLNPKYFDLIIDSSHISVDQEVKEALKKFNQGY